MSESKTGQVERAGLMTTPEAALALSKIADELVPGIRHDFGLVAEERLHDAGYALTPLAPKVPPPMDKTDALELAWGVIANAGNGDWTKETPEWQEAAVRWRDAVMPALSAELATRTPEPPDSGDGAARSRSVIRRENVQAGRPMNEGIEPPDSGDGAEPTTLTFDRVKCGTCGADLSRYSTAATAHVCAANTGSDAVSWSAGFYCARHEAFCQVAHRKQPDREVRLRSGSPAPEGGE